MGLIMSNPYNALRGEFAKGEKENTEYLTEEEMKAFESIHPVAGTEMALSRDLFVFQMYTGLSYSDAQSFDISQYKKIDGKWRRTGERIKTGVPFVNMLLPPAVEVLERYGMKIPKISNENYNRNLKALGMCAGISIPLHSHLARHTFATFMLRNGVKIENLAKMLGHADISRTQRYAIVLAESVHEDFAMIEEKLKGKKRD
jgi:integrase